jgi:hypothetical protein
VLGIEEIQHLAGGSNFQKGTENQGEAGLYFLVRVLTHPLCRVANQAHWQEQGQFASLGFVEQSSGHAEAIPKVV